MKELDSQYKSLRLTKFKGQNNLFVLIDQELIFLYKHMHIT